MNDETLEFEVESEPVRVIVDEPPETAQGTVLLLSPFGMNASSMFVPSYVLSSNGFRVLRLDPRNSPDGTATALRGFRMSKLSHDIGKAVDRFSPDGVFALSLSAPAALRALAGRPVTAVSLAIPVVNVRPTITAVLDEDWFARMAWDEETPFTRVLGHDVDTDMIRDCRRSGFESLDDTRRDLAALGDRTALFASDVDPWVDIDEVRDVAAGTGTRLVEIPLAGHVLYRNPALAMRFFEQATTWLAERIHPGAPPVTVPSFAEVVRALEKVRRPDLQETR